MTEGDSQDLAEESPLRQARLRAGWSQAAAMRRFQDAVSRGGETAPAGASLRRMFAYWESGERAVTVAAYQRAFMEIYRLPVEALGFAPPDGSGRLAAIRSQPLKLVQIDDELVALFEMQTQYLRELDRRLGSAAQALQTKSHVDQVSSVLHRSVGGRRQAVAAALAEAAALAGWQALDRSDIASAWDYHETAKGAALESDAPAVSAHVTAQQGFILLDVDDVAHGNSAMDEAAEAATTAPALMQAWLAAAKAEALAAAGDATEAKRSLDRAARLLDTDGSEELPYLMLTEQHLARWRGHCLARLGDREALEMLPLALSAESDSVRAAISLHADMALALLNAGLLGEARDEATKAVVMAERYGSARQRRRLVRILALAKRQDVE